MFSLGDYVRIISNGATGYVVDVFTGELPGYIIEDEFLPQIYDCLMDDVIGIEAA